MMSHAVVCLALLSVATVSAQYPVSAQYQQYPVSSQYPVPSQYGNYPYTVNSAGLLTNALSSSYGTSPALYNPFIPIGGAAFGISVEGAPCLLEDGVTVQARFDDDWYPATIVGAEIIGTGDVVNKYKVEWSDGEQNTIPTSDIVAVCEFTDVPTVCEVDEELDITNFDTGIDVSRTIKYKRTLTCDCDGNQNPIAETCYRPSDMPPTCQIALYPCDVALKWDLDGVNFAGEAFPLYSFSIKKELECQCNVAGEPDFPTCIDLDAQEAWERAKFEYEAAYEKYLEDQAAAVALYESNAAQQAIDYQEYAATLASGEVLQAAAYEQYIASLAVGFNSTIVELAVATADLSTLVVAITRVPALVSTLSGAGPFTVFAPNNAAFAKVPTATLNNLLAPENEAELVNVLTYHVIAGVAARAGDLSDGQEIETVQGGTVKVGILSNGNVYINDALVISADIDATNGVVHIIDTVLIPPVVTDGPGPGR